MPLVCFPGNSFPVYGERTNPGVLRVQKRFCFLDTLPASPSLSKHRSPYTSQNTPCCQFLSLQGFCNVNHPSPWSSSHRLGIQCSPPADPTPACCFHNFVIVLSSPGLFVSMGLFQMLKYNKSGIWKRAELNVYVKSSALN